MNAELLRQQRRRPKYFEKRHAERRKANEDKNYVPSLFPYKLTLTFLS